MSSGRGAAGRPRGVISERTTASRLPASAGGSATEPTRRSPVYRGVRSCPSSCLSPSADGLTHAHAGGHTLAQGSRAGLDARGPAVFRMPRALAIELTETLDVVERDRQLAEPLVVRIDRLDAGEVQQRVQQ